MPMRRKLSSFSGGVLSIAVLFQLLGVSASAQTIQSVRVFRLADAPDGDSGAIAGTRGQAPSSPPPVPIKPAPPVPACNEYRLRYDQRLSPTQRTCIYASHLLTPSAIFGAAFASGYAQLLRNDPPEWGHDPLGYGRSFGTRYAQGMTKATGEFLSALITKEDPRRQRSKKTNFFGRIWYAGTSLVVDRHSAAPRLAAATVIGAFSSGFVGMAWYPTPEDTVRRSLRRSGASLAGSLIYAELYEFEPDIFKVIGKWFSPKLK